MSVEFLVHFQILDTMNSQGNGPWDRGIIWPNIACQEFRVERVIRW
jgi:hypothetical protein